MSRAPWLLVVWLFANPASAQQEHGQAFPVGEEALGMGGAYTGLAEDASAAFYNPGGLPLGHRGSVGVSLSLSLVDEYRVGAFDADSTALEYRDALGVPFYAGGSIQFGDERGVLHSLAFATFAPNNVRRRFVAGSDDAGLRALQVHRTDRTRWYGGSYGIRPIPQLGIGISGFVATRSLRHEEEELFADSTDAGFTRLAQIQLNAELLVFRLGVLWRPDPTVSFGLTLQPPGIVVGGRASVIGSATVSTPATGTETGFLSEEIAADSPLPFQMRVGFAWRPSPSWAFTIDGTLEGPIGSEDEPARRLNLTVVDQPGLLGSYFANRYHTDWSANFAVGGRGVIEDLVPISAGFFTSFSSAPSIPDVATLYQPDRVHIVGASVGVGIITDDVDFNVGVVGAFGFGRGLSAAPFTGLDSPQYVAADVSSTSIFLYFTGVGDAVGAVGRTVAEEILGVDDDEVDELIVDEEPEAEPEAEAVSEAEPDSEADSAAEPEANAEPEQDEPEPDPEPVPEEQPPTITPEPDPL